MRAVIAVYLREIKRILYTPNMRTIYFVVPLIIFALFAALYSKQYVHNIPITIFDEDHSELSRKMITFLESSSSVTIASYSHSLSDVQTSLSSSSTHGAVHFPKNFQADIKKGKQATIDIYRDGAGILYAGLLKKSLSEVILTVNGGIVLARSEMSGNGTSFSKAFANPIRVKKSVLYNSSYNYLNYLVPGVTTVTIQMILVMIAVLLINSEVNNKTFKSLVITAGGSPWAIIFGKLLAHYMASLYLLIFLMGVIFPVTGIPDRSYLLPLFVLYSFFSIGSIAMGMALSSFELDPLVAGDLALFYTAPAFVFSGFTFPIWALPWFDQLYARIIPYTFFSEGFLQLFQQGVPLSGIYGSLIPLSAFSVFGIFVSYVGVNKQIRGIRVHV